MLYENEVSPIHLVDIIGPYVDEYVNDFNKIYSENVDIVRI